MPAPRLRKLAAVALFSVAVPAAGCGAQTTQDSATRFTGEQRAVAQTIEDLQAAGAKRDEGKICDRLLAQNLVRAIAAKHKTCANGLGDSLDDVDTFEVQVVRGGVTISGATAKVKVSSEHGSVKRADTLTLVKEKGRWKLSGLGAAS